MSYTERTVDWIIGKAYVVAKAKSTPPTSGSPKYDALVDIVDSEYKNIVNDPDVDLDSFYQTVNTGTVSATDTYDLDDEINRVSKREGDFVLVTNGTNTTPFTVVAPNELYAYRYKNACAKIGRTLKFSKAFASDSPMLGYSIMVPSYGFAEDLTKSNDTIAIDDDMCLVYAVAAEAARNDTIKTSQYDNILQKLEQHMQRLRRDNGGQVDTLATVAFAQGESW